MISQQLTTNLASGLRREKIGTCEYLVAPVTMIVPGVLAGNQGPILYTEPEIRRSVDSWNHVPLTDGHPSESARSASVLKKIGLGLLLNAQVDSAGRLKGEAWFDVEAVRRIRPSLISDLQSSRKIEASTGLGMDIDNRPGVTNGKEFQFVARNYRPDHLAILVDKTGACSIRDGCGVFNSSTSKDRAGLTEPIPPSVLIF